MANGDGGRFTGRLAAALAPAALKRRAAEAAAVLKAEYEAGKRGDDDTPVTPLWSSPKEQLDAFVAMLRSARNAVSSSDDERAAEATTPGGEAAAPEHDDVSTVTAAMRGVDWAAVRTATTERGADATRVMRTMADQVDWTKVQPVAGQVTSALIAAVASGHLPVGGRVGSTVARAIVDQGGLGQRITQRVTDEGTSLPPDFRRTVVPGVIEATGIEVAPPPPTAPRTDVR
ncbi:MAG: hypothetical protein WD023_06595 [Ilumatobacteraceae bacterium]